LTQVGQFNDEVRDGLMSLIIGMVLVQTLVSAATIFGTP
jgi:hypothetical protein